MGGHGCDIIWYGFEIIVYGWAWAKAKHIGRGHWMGCHSMLSRIRAPNHLHLVRWVHPSVCFLLVKFWVGSWVYKVTDLEKNEIIAAVSLTLLTNRDTAAKINIFLWWKLKGAPHSPSCRAWRIRFCAFLHPTPNWSQTSRMQEMC